MLINIDMHVEDLIIDNKVNPMYIRASSFLLEKYQLHFDQCTNDNEKDKLLSSLWDIEYNAVVKSKQIFFNSEKAKTIFLLRWS